jgi:hypothetical protein
LIYQLDYLEGGGSFWIFTYDFPVRFPIRAGGGGGLIHIFFMALIRGGEWKRDRAWPNKKMVASLLAIPLLRVVEGQGPVKPRQRFDKFEIRANAWSPPQGGTQ